jgi:transcriptional regulator with XRE-family HTH domain
MAKRKKTRIAHAESVLLFAGRLREVRASRGMTQAELAHKARISEAYIGRLERGQASPGVDLVDRLARALGATSADLLPTQPPPDTLAVLKGQARALFDTVLQSADRETLLVLNPLLRLMVAEKR